MPLQPCPIPYIGDNCQQTYAEAAGSAYTIYQALFLTISILLFVITTIQNIRLFRIRGITLHDYVTSVPHQLYALTWITSVVLVIRATDPHGWADRLPQWAEEQCLIIGTACVYNMLLVAVMSWIKIIRSITGRSSDIVTYFERFLFSLMFIWSIVFGALYSETRPSYVYSTINIAFDIAFNVIVMTMGWWYGVSIYLHLARYASSHNDVSSTNKTPNTVKADKAKVRVIIHLQFAITICSIIAIVFQIMAIANNIRTKYESVFDTWEYPTFTFGGIFAYASFPIAQGLSIITVLVFFRKLYYDGSSPSSSPSRQQHSSGNRTHEENRSPDGSKLPVGKNNHTATTLPHRMTTSLVQIIHDTPGQPPQTPQRQSFIQPQQHPAFTGSEDGQQLQMTFSSPTSSPPTAPTSATSSPHQAHHSLLINPHSSSLSSTTQNTPISRVSLPYGIHSQPPTRPPPPPPVPAHSYSYSHPLPPPHPHSHSHPHPHPPPHPTIDSDQVYIHMHVTH